MERFQLAALGFFYALFIGRTVYLHRQGERVLVIGRGKRGGHALLEVVFMAALGIWTYEIVSRCLADGLSLVPAGWQDPLIEGLWPDLLGAAVISIGLLIFAAALLAFGRSWRIGIDHERPGQLVTEGIFAWSRNPVFLFLDLYFLGSWLIQGDLFFLLFAVVAIAGIHYQIGQEERFLLRYHGEAYRRYMQAVPRYWGRYRERSRRVGWAGE